MTKVFHAGRIPGTSNNVVSIYEGGDDSPLTDPAGNISRVYFDTRFDYLNLVKTVDTSVSMAAEGVVTNCGKKGKDCSAIVRQGERIYNLGAHGQSYIPAVLMYDLSNSRALTGSQFVQSISNTSFRLCHVFIDSTYVYLKERWFVRYNNLPVFNANYRMYILNKPAV